MSALSRTRERKFCSGSKMKEMTGSGIFADKGENGDSEASNPANKTSVRMYQLSEAKTKELSGSDIFGPPPEIPARPLAARNMELQGNVDFSLPPPRSIHTSVKVSNPAGGPSNISFGEDPVVKTAKKIHNQKFQELTGNNIFNENAPASAEKSLSSAKLKEMSGSDIFADGKAASRDYLGGVRKPPGGESSIALI
ncbi:hypothetical protein PR202_ga20114 [Eleusine coracana subsp. coracana]|uniref:DUF4057 domain-containing protein n=1 Tax=Eleusine coracana subsp. coracana TaxID=191504 RepID=A0AAV5CXB4_ELECO|nr:hypothetical protein PR202_ga20114 [Eleusine coracana subsp. coracana]